MDIVKAFNAASRDPELKLRYDGMRSITPDTKNEYLSKFDNVSDRGFAEKVLNSTIYVPGNVLLEELNRSFDSFADKIGNDSFYIFVPKEKFSSEHIFTIHLWNKIIRKNFIKFINVDSDVKDGTNVIIIDDCIYTGNNTLNTIDQMTYNNKNKTINFHLIIPYVSYWGKIAITGFKNRLQFPVLNFYDKIRIINFFAIPENEIYEGMIDKFRLQYHHQVAIYFDHKVANEFSTFDSIYLRGIIPGQKDYGLLINYPPDTDLKNRIYNKYFVGLNLFT